MGPLDPQNAPVLEGASLRLGRKRLPLRSGAMHYWRNPRDQWRAALTQLKGLGLPMVETYVPWGVHERPEGGFDFGETDPRKDLSAFLTLAAELDLYVFLRPGPHINAELTYFGLPERVVRDAEIQARTPRGNPVTLYFPPRMFPVPSHASEAYFEAIGDWYGQLAPVVAPHVWPNGPVVMLQIDNEAGYFFRNGPFCQDYHPDAISAWHTFLETRHGSLETAGTRHGRDYSAWPDAQPPRGWDVGKDLGQDGAIDPHRALCRQLDWAKFQEHLLTRAVDRMKRQWFLVAPPVPTVHNLSLGDGGLPASPPAMAEAVDLVGFDYYHAAGSDCDALRTIKRRTLYLSGTFGSGYAPELGVGAPPWFTPLSSNDSITCALAAMAYGLRGFNLYMAVDRDRWYGAPIDAQGAARPEADEWRRLLDALEALEFETLERPARVALLWPREYARLSRATHLLGLASPANLEAMNVDPTAACRPDTFGFEEPIQWAWWQLLATFADALTAANVPYVFVDSEVSAERLKSFDVVFAPTYEFTEAGRWSRLVEAAASGTHVVYGPQRPTLDDRLEPLDAAVGTAPLGDPVSVGSQHAVHALVHEWIERFGLERPYPALVVDTAVHRRGKAERSEASHVPGTGFGGRAPKEHRDGDRDAVLFVVNEGPARNAQLTLPAERDWTRLRDALTGEVFAEDPSMTRLTLPMTAQHVRLLVMETDADAAADTSAAETDHA